MFKKKSLIHLSVLSTSFLLSCTHIFESKNTEIDLTVFKNVIKNLDTLTTNIERSTSAENNSNAIIGMVISSVERDINGQNRKHLNLEKEKVNATKKIKNNEPANVVLVESVLSEVSTIPSHEIELIEHNGFSGKIKNNIDFNKLNWNLPKESKNNNANKEDEIIDSVQTASAATVELKNVSKNEIVEDDDLQVFEYKNESNQIGKSTLNERDIDTYQLPDDLKFASADNGLNKDSDVIKYAEAKISSSVLNVIKRESNTDLIEKNKDRINDLGQGQIVPDLEDAPSVYEIADTVKKEASSSLKKIANNKDSQKNAFTEMPTDGVQQINYKILARVVDPEKNTTSEGFGFEFIPHYDRNDRISDVSGEINLEYSILGSQNVVSGMVLKQGHMDIQTDLDLNSRNQKIVIPLIESEKFEKFLRKNKLATNGSYVLVNTTKGYSDIEIDNVKQPKVFLTSKFKITEKTDEATFILVPGLSAGNNFVRIKSESGWKQKVLNTQENMITYIDEDARESIDQSLELYTESKTGKFVELATNSIDANLVSSKNIIRKISTNKIAFKTQESLSTQKNYLQLKKESTTYIGIGEQESEVNVPSQREKELIMTEFGVNDLQNSCIIQINASDDLARLRIGGPSDVGEVYTQVLYSDREGNLSNEISEWTNKAYILGDRIGVMNIQAEYSNKAVKMTNSYCSNDLYIVENL